MLTGKFQEGVEEGIVQGKTAIIRAMLNKSLTDEDIIQLSGLSRTELRQLKQEKD